MRILMVCLGNICRSPLAHGILRQKTIALNWTVDSAGTSAYHSGEGPDPRSVSVARKHNLNIRDLVSRNFEVEDFDHFDIIYAMDKSNFANILKLARTKKDEDKVKLILNELEPSLDYEVPDPYYGGDHGFENVYKMLDEATDMIVKKYD